MPLFSCKFEATIGGESGQQRIQPNNPANNENRQPNNEANQRQPNNENRQPGNEANERQPNNENRQPDNEANQHQPNKENPQPNNPVNPDSQNNENRQPNNSENANSQNKGNRQPKTPAKSDPENKGNRHPNNPENLDPGNNDNRQYNYTANPALPNFGTGDRRLFSIASQAVSKPLFIPRGDTTPTVGVAVDGRLSSTNKRPGVNMAFHSSKLQKMDDPPNLFGRQTSNLVPENGLGKDYVQLPDLSLRVQAPRNNGNGRFYNSNRDIIIIPTTDAINEQVRCGGNYEVWNLSVRHKVHGEVVFLGSRDLSKLEADLSKTVQFCHGNFTLGPNIQHDPLMCTLNNISREDLAKQVSKTGGPPNNDELYRILAALAIVTNAKCWSYNEQEKEWTFLTCPSSKANCKQGGQSKQESQKESKDDSDDDDDQDYDDNDDQDNRGRYIR